MQFLTKSLIDETIGRMLQEKGSICVSVIVPTHRLSPDRRADQLQVEKAAERARQYLRGHYSESQSRPLISSLDDLLEQIDFLHQEEGIGLFVCPDFQSLIRFVFPVTEKVIVAADFELRDVLMQQSYHFPYHVLQVSQQDARLFGGRCKSLDEIRDQTFPMKYEEDYDYDPPIRSSSHSDSNYRKDVEKDNSVLEQTRYQGFVHALDEQLKKYLSDDQPLVVMGSEKELDYFKITSRYGKNIVALLPGNYSRLNKKELADMVWPVVMAYVDEQVLGRLGDLSEKMGHGRALAGIQEVWQAASEGRGGQLLVEKDYHMAGFTGAGDNRLYLRQAPGPHLVLADAVNELVVLVLEKDGEVIFLSNGMLRDHQHVALITRY